MGAINSTWGAPTGTTSLSTAGLTNGTSITFTPTVEDSSGTAITGLTASDFTLNVGSQTVAASSASYAGSGVYNVVFLPLSLTPGTATVGLSVSGTSIGQQANVTVNTGAAVSAKSSAVFPSGTTLNAGGTYTVTVTLEDANGNPVTGATGTVGAASSDLGATYTTSATEVSSTSDQYTVTLTAPSTVTTTAAPLSFTLDGLTFTSSSNYTVVNQTASTAVPTWSSLASTLTEGAAYSVPVVVKDASGNVVTGLTKSDFSMTYTQGSNSAAPVTISGVTEDSSTGTYTVAFDAPTPSSSSTTYTLGMSVSGVSASASSAITPGTAPSSTSVGSQSSVSWPTSLSSGNQSTITVQLEDASGNPLALPSNYNVVLEQMGGGTLTGGTDTTGNIPTAGDVTSSATPALSSGSATTTGVFANLVLSHFTSV